MRIRKKKYTNANVLDAAMERTRYLYKSFDTVCVSFSGGKDSTAVLNLCIEVARELDRLPVRAIFFDEEAIHPPTIEYIARVRENPDVALEWYCLPVKHRNACSNDEPFWTCWEQSKRAIWVRDMPEWGIKTHPMFKMGMSFQEFCPQIVGRNGVIVQGIRAQESFRRMRMMLMKKNDNFICSANGKSAYPIYDWSSEDVWRLVHERGYDYNRTYDTFNRTKKYNQLLSQRVCPPFGEEPLRGLWLYAECWPEMWHRMLNRVTGAATAWRYSNTELYSSTAKPDSMNWRDYCALIVANYSESTTRKTVENTLKFCCDQHALKTNDEIPMAEPHPLSGCSWKFLTMIAIKGDFKLRHAKQMQPLAEKTRKKLGITFDESLKRYGKSTYKQSRVVTPRPAQAERLQPQPRRPAGNGTARNLHH